MTYDQARAAEAAKQAARNAQAAAEARAQAKTLPDATEVADAVIPVVPCVAKPYVTLLARILGWFGY